MKKQIYNPYLPSFEYIPDGEPHVFGSRLYIYGSHDRFDGAMFCLNDYVCYSADVNDLTSWKYEGIIYRKEQDPRNQNISADEPEPKPAYGLPHEPGQDNLNPPGIHAMWAPDVAKGADGRYYLYYCMDWLPEVAVAVCDTPAGQYEFWGFVHYENGTLLGCGKEDYVSFDPGIFVDDDGAIYLYSGNAPLRPEIEDGMHALVVMRLDNDMLTIKEKPHLLLPSVLNSRGTGFEGHEFFEASSIRKVKENYYFIYSSVNSHELCYAVSDTPDRGYSYGGTIVDIGDVFLNGRTEQEALNALGNTHGSIECVNGQWYVFYHRQTNRTNFSRQACAEKIMITEEGKIRQAEVTSCGLNDGPLLTEGQYPANMCCRLQSSFGAVFSHPASMGDNYPYLTQDMKDKEPTEELTAEDEVCPIQYIANMKDGAVSGYKYFQNSGADRLSVKVRGEAKGWFFVTGGTGEKDASETEYGRIRIESEGTEWKEYEGKVELPEGVFTLNFRYCGSGRLDFRSFTFY